jgi:hypothetical protein
MNNQNHFFKVVKIVNDDNNTLKTNINNLDKDLQNKNIKIISNQKTMNSFQILKNTTKKTTS